jgi:hypothetical protein
MAKYFLHLRDGTDELLDPEGVECPDMDGLRSIVLRNARDIIAGDVLQGTVDLRYRIDAETGAGAIVHTLPFADAITFVGLGANGQLHQPLESRPLPANGSPPPEDDQAARLS